MGSLDLEENLSSITFSEISFSFPANGISVSRT